MFKSAIKTPEIEFLCLDEDYGVIPEPYPASKYMPEWFKKLPGKVNNQDILRNSTVKRCAPFLDAMCIGWIIPLAADIEVKSNEDCSKVETRWHFNKTMVEGHSTEQISSDAAKNPLERKSHFKIINYWIIKVPKDYSILFVPPLNRNDSRFTCYSGLVHCDEYSDFYINFPTYFNTPNYTGVIKSGTPLIQAIPIKRSSSIKKYKTGIIDSKKIEKMQKKLSANETFYRDKIWKKGK